MTLNEISNWLNHHKLLLTIATAIVSAGFTYFVSAEEFKTHVDSQAEVNQIHSKAIKLLNYDLQLATVRDDIEFLLDGREELELSSKERRKLDRLYRDEQRYESKLVVD